VRRVLGVLVLRVLEGLEVLVLDVPKVLLPKVLLPEVLLPQVRRVLPWGLLSRVSRLACPVLFAPLALAAPSR
jgi:hypothetical protein